MQNCKNNDFFKIFVNQDKLNIIKKAKAVPLHAMEALGGGEEV
jgi:hypothetical protein